MSQTRPDVHARLESRADGILLRVDTRRQVMDLIRNGLIERSYPVSTSRFGLGTEPGSLKTPTGRFVIAEKFGHGAAPGTIFKSRLPTGEIAGEGGQEDLILTRILWLDGVEENNTNTKGRYVYIHGTNQESLIGQPASHGCVRMRNADIVELFEAVPEGAPVEILV